MPSAVRATGRVSDGGIVLTTPLGFLRAGSELSVASSDGKPRRARVASVGIHAEDGVPRLAISLSLLDLDALPASIAPMSDDADPRWFPEISIEAAEEAIVASEVEPDPTLRTPHALWTEPPPRGPVSETLLLPRPATLGRGRFFVAASLFCLGAVVVWLMTGRATPEPAPVAEIAAPPVQPEEAKPAEAKVELTTVPTTAETTATATPATPSAATPLFPAPPAATASPAAEPTHVARAPISDGPWHPMVTTGGGRDTLVVPLSGGQKPLATFTMSDPPGLAVDLPHGKTTVPLRSYLIHDSSFRSVWVRARPEGGLQIRLHYAKGTHVSAELVDGGLRFRSR
jgi:hypothetical protein